MAISTYAELQTAAANWLIRADLTARIPEFITLAEARLNRVLRMRLGEVDAALTGVVGSREIALPGAYSEALNLWIDLGTGRQQLQRFTDPALLETDITPGQPYRWTINGATLAFERPCDQAYPFTLRCMEKYALSDGAPTNSLLTDCPDAYLFATLCEAGPFLRDADVSNAYEQKLTRAIQEINAKEARSRAPQNLVTEPALLQRAGRRGGFDIRSGF